MRSMTLYAIKRRGSDWFMPATRSTHKTKVELDYTSIPRLFETRRAAQCALTWWLQGVTHAEVVYGDDDGIGYLTTEPRPDRKAEDMMIVKMKLMDMLESDV